MKSIEGTSEKGLNILCIDGGGVRGLSSLLILKEVMLRVQKFGGNTVSVKPCEYFDIIAGTGTGGLSACLVGRLKMSIDDAILSFEKIMREIFSAKKLFRTGAFKSTTLQEAIIKVIREATGNANESMMEKVDETSSKTMVFAMSNHNMSAELPIIFRSYEAFSNPGPDCTIWQAICATMAHPNLFKAFDIRVGDINESFVDAGVKCSNPLTHVLAEVKRMYPDKHVASIVSIGAGHARTIESPKSWWSLTIRPLPANVVSALKNVATDNERVANEMDSRFGDTRVYFRFNVDQGLQDVGMSKWEDSSQVAAHTRSYIAKTDVMNRLDKAGAMIRRRRAVISTVSIDGQINSGTISRVVLKRYPVPTPIFGGREDEIKRILDCLTTERPERRVCVVYGLGGAGKTQVVLKAIEQSEDQWPVVVHVDSSSQAAIKNALQQYASTMGVGESHEATIEWLQQRREQWLLVFDGVDKPDIELPKYFPKGNHGNIIITTRRRDLIMYARGTDASHDVTRMRKEDALELLVKLACPNNPPVLSNQLEAADTLLKEFEYFALAIVQAGAYIAHADIDFLRYKKLFLARKKDTLEQYDNLADKPDGYSKTVYTTWIMCYDLLSPNAQQVLWILGHLYHNGITESLFRRAALNSKSANPWYLAMNSRTPFSLEENAALESTTQLLFKFLNNQEWDTFKFLKVMGEISSLSLIEVDRVNESYSIHLLVQDWARAISQSSSVNALECATALLAISVKYGDNATEELKFRRTLALHVDHAVLARGGSVGVHHAAAFAEVYYDKGLFEQSRRMRLNVLETQCSCLGETDSITLRTMSLLATTYWQLGQFNQASELQEKVLDIRIRELGATHPDTLEAKNMLASTYSSMGRLDESEKLLEDSLRDPSALFLSPSLLPQMSQTYYKRGDYSMAKKLDEFRIIIMRTKFGEEHPDTLAAMSNLASTHAQLGEWNEAERLDREVLEIQRRILGPEHRETIYTMENLASTYSQDPPKRFQDSEKLCKEVLDTRKRIYGEKDCLTLFAAHNLLRLYERWPQKAKADELEKEIEKMEELAGPSITKEARRQFEDASKNVPTPL